MASQRRPARQPHLPASPSALDLLSKGSRVALPALLPPAPPSRPPVVQEASLPQHLTVLHIIVQVWSASAHHILLHATRHEDRRQVKVTSAHWPAATHPAPFHSPGMCRCTPKHTLMYQQLAL